MADTYLMKKKLGCGTVGIGEVISGMIIPLNI